MSQAVQTRRVLLRRRRRVLVQVLHYGRIADRCAVLLIRVVGAVEQTVAAVRPRNAHARVYALEPNHSSARRLVHQWRRTGVNGQTAEVCAAL